VGSLLGLRLKESAEGGGKTNTRTLENGIVTPKGKKKKDGSKTGDYIKYKKNGKKVKELKNPPQRRGFNGKKRKGKSPTRRGPEQTLRPKNQGKGNGWNHQSKVLSGEKG